MNGHAAAHGHEYTDNKGRSSDFFSKSRQNATKLDYTLHHVYGAHTTYFNVKRARSGHLFQGRYKAIVVEKDEYAKELSRYIHLNPVRAKMVPAP